MRRCAGAGQILESPVEGAVEMLDRAGMNRARPLVRRRAAKPDRDRRAEGAWRDVALAAEGAAEIRGGHVGRRQPAPVLRSGGAGEHRGVEGLESLLVQKILHVEAQPQLRVPWPER